MTFDIFIGWDSREVVATEVAAHSIRKRTFTKHRIHYLRHRELRKAGLFSRPWMIDADTGNFRDAIDAKPFSTEFSHTRFLIPELMGFKGWALFFDADMIFVSDIKKLIGFIDNKYAVMCVKHQHTPIENSIKMDGRLQQNYFRKNWSSFVLWNCGHPANARLTKEKVNFMKGSDLHAFSWLRDEYIGALPMSYNYIAGLSPKGTNPDVIHYTEGGPWFDNYQDAQFGDLWVKEYEDWQRDADHGGKVTFMPTTKYDREK